MTTIVLDSQVVRNFPDIFREAGEWLDKEYSAEKCFKCDLANYDKHYPGDFPTVDSWESKILRLRTVAWDLLEGRPENKRELPTPEYALRLVLVDWLFTDPKTDKLKIQITKFQDLTYRNLPHDLMRCTTDSICYTDEWRKLFEQSLVVVRQHITEQTQEGQREAGVEWSHPMTKAEMARRITRNPNARTRDIEELLEKRYDVEHIKGYIYRIRIDSMDKRTKECILTPLKK